jgi:hypothetical protein
MKAGQLQIGDELGFVNREQLFNSVEFDDQLTRNDNVQPEVIAQVHSR